MAFPIDADMFCYAWSTLKVMFGSKTRLRQNTRPIPLHYDYEVLADEQLTPGQQSYLAPTDAQLAALQFRPVCTYRVKNYGQNLIRIYHNPADPTTCSLTIVEVKVDVNGTKGVRNSSSAAFTTRLANGKRFITKNMALKSLFDKPDYIEEQRLPNVTNLTQLKKMHEEQAAKFGPAQAPPRDVENILKETEAEHQRYSQFQLSKGVYQLSADRNFYLVTDKVFDRGIRNHFLPFGQRWSLAQVLFSGLLGAVLPLIGILKIAPWLTRNSGVDPTGNAALSGIAIAACYVLAGSIIGWLCDTQKFTWVMLTAYLPAHLLAGWSYGWFPYATLLFTTSYVVAQAKRRKALILQT